MLSSYLQFAPWLGIVLGGVLGCTLLGLIAMSRGAGFADVAGNPGKQLWSVIFAIPVPFLLELGAGGWIGLLIAFVWLVASPIIGLKTVFKPEATPDMTQLVIAHVIFAIIVLTVFMSVVHLMA